MSSSTPPAPEPDQQAGPPIPPGYKPGDYIPFADRDPNNPSSIAGQWADPARQAQMGGDRVMTEEERYREIYGYDAPTRVLYASWGRRVLGTLVDGFFTLVAGLPFIFGNVMASDELEFRIDPVTGEAVETPQSDLSDATVALLTVGLLIVLVFSFYNHVIRQGRTGYTFGKAAVGIRLLKESTGRPMGMVMCFVRQLAHYVDSLLCYLGWLWPLWDAKRQTIADKIMGTVVVIQSPDSAS
jgi:uncharacterized RDD family membrane protein YckC